MLTSEEILASFSPYFDSRVLNEISHGLGALELPIVHEQSLIHLIKEVKKIFAAEDAILHVQSPCIVIGDLHGHLLDLLRVIAQNGLPDKVKYLFLGDIVDRGEFSLETLILIITLKHLYPDNVYVIRGNHEFSLLCTQMGFLAEINSTYKNSLIYSVFMELFSYMPVAAIINKQILCVHGGIGPEINSLDQIAAIQRPLEDYNQVIVNALLWSDPSDIIKFFHPSQRGMGYLFGETGLKTFLAENHMKVLIRGHECVTEGLDFKFNNELITVFSASNYCGSTGNTAGVLMVRANSSFQVQKYQPLPYIKREKVNFKPLPMVIQPEIKKSDNTVTLKLKLPTIIKSQPPERPPSKSSSPQLKFGFQCYNYQNSSRRASGPRVVVNIV